MKKVFLKKDREKLWLSGHPWIYSGAIDKIEQNIIPGSVVEVLIIKTNLLDTDIIIKILK